MPKGVFAEGQSDESPLDALKDSAEYKGVVKKRYHKLF